eukprot:CAMPEP_0174723716 /NCGR_PEP_ID=MMETSP1094-20130205/41663_1 /TAXON_ID=156173 /ORGANISM="Chrysochromulina brevifilum, Strain UTEX LB 985" /LENGTH=62 /DNA_ID=CAMNT_0015924805 /DNA_START=791 /DNA_END=976 /DNA_ORIENTATION=-
MTPITCSDESRLAGSDAGPGRTVAGVELWGGVLAGTTLWPSSRRPAVSSVPPCMSTACAILE